MAVLGASLRQRSGFLWTESRAILAAGVVGGVLTGSVVAYELVKVLTGIFDPPPQHPSIPWGLLTVLLSAVLVTGIGATAASARWVGRVDATRLRDL